MLSEYSEHGHKQGECQRGCILKNETQCFVVSGHVKEASSPLTKQEAIENATIAVTRTLSLSMQLLRSVAYGYGFEVHSVCMCTIVLGTNQD